MTWDRWILLSTIVVGLLLAGCGSGGTDEYVGGDDPEGEGPPVGGDDDDVDDDDDGPILDDDDDDTSGDDDDDTTTDDDDDTTPDDDDDTTTDDDDTTTDDDDTTGPADFFDEVDTDSLFGGAPGSAGAPLVWDGDETAYAAAVRGGILVVYTIDDAGDVTAKRVASATPAVRPALAIDPSGTLHVLYIDWYHRDLRYATNGDKGWTTRKVVDAGDVDEAISIAADADGNAHAVYYNSGSDQLRYATNASGNWLTSRITDDYVSDYYNTRYGLAVTSEGEPLVFFFDSYNDSYVMAERFGSGWTTTTIINDVATGDCGVFVDGDDNVHLTYMAGGSWDSVLRYATNKSGGWNSQQVDADVEGAGVCSHVTVDADGFVHTCHLTRYGTPKCATNASGRWRSLYVDVDPSTDIENQLGVAFDNDTNALVAYFDESDADLKLARTDGSAWELHTIDDSGALGVLAGAGLDADGHAHVAFSLHSSFDENRLRYATNRTGSWRTETLAVAEIDDAALALDPNGDVHVCACSRYSYDELTYATNVGGTWATEVIDDLGSQCAIAADADGKAHIVSGSPLTYLTNAGGMWQTAEIGASYYSFAAIAVDEDGYAHVSFDNPSAETLNFATNRSGDWVVEVVDDVDDPGRTQSLFLDESGNAHILYFVDDPNRLAYATNESGDWNTETVCSSGYEGYTGQLVIDGNGHARFSYHDDTNTGALGYGDGILGWWRTGVVADSGNFDIGYQSAMALDADEHLYFFYSGASAVWQATATLAKGGR